MIRIGSGVGRVAAGALAAMSAVACLGPTQTPTPSPLDGVRQFGILIDVDRATREVTYRPAEFFDGDDAFREAARDGVDIADPVYIREGDAEVSLPLADGAIVRVLMPDARGDLVLQPVAAEDFLLDPSVGEATALFWFLVQDGQIRAMDAQYVP